MSDLDALIASLALGDAQKKIIAESDPYFGGMQIADQIGGAIAQSGPQFSTRDKIIGGALAGLTGGLFSGASQDYQSRAQNAYTDVLQAGALGQEVARPSVLSGGLFNAAKQQSTLFQLRKAMQAGDLQNDINKAILIKQGEAGITAEIERQKSKDSLIAQMAKQIGENPKRAAQISAAYAPLLEGKTLIASPIAASTAVQPVSDIGQNADGSLIYGETSATPAIAPQLDAAAPAKAVDPLMSKALGILGPTFTVPESIEDKQTRIAQRYMDDGATPSAAFEAAGKQIEADRLALKSAFTRGADVRRAAEETFNLANTAEQGIQGAGSTGGPGIISGPRNVLSSLWQFVSPEEAAQRASTSVLDSVSPKIVQAERSPGAISDFETKMLIGAGPSSSNTPEQNRAIISKMRGVGKLNNEYADFLDWYRDKFNTMTGSEQVWGAYKKENPLVVKDATGKIDFNQARPSVFEWLGSGGATAGTTGGAAQSVAVVPEDAAPPETQLQSPGEVFAGGLTNILNSATLGLGDEIVAGGNAGLDAIFGGPGYDARLAQTRTLRKDFRDQNPATALLGDLGGGAATIAKAGATKTGAKILGLEAIPAATTAQKIGAAAKSGAKIGGLYGFGEGEGGAMNRLESAAGGATAGAATGGALQAAGSALKGVSNMAGDAIESATQKLFGVSTKNIADSMKRGRTYVDDIGAEVLPSTEAELRTKLTQDMAILKKDGVLSAATNNPKDNLALFDAGKADAQKAVTGLRDQVKALLTSPTWRRNPKTGQGGFMPDFSNVKAEIARIAESDPQMKTTLTRRADDVINRWNKSSRSWDMLQEKKGIFGESANWKLGLNAKDQAWNAVKKQINRSFANEQNRAFDSIMKITDPSKVGALAQANRRFHAYSNLEDGIVGRAARGRNQVDVDSTPSAIKSLFGSGRNPATYINQGARVQGAAGLLGRGAEAAAPGAAREASILNSQAMQSEDPTDAALSQALQSVRQQPAIQQEAAVNADAPMEEVMTINPIVSQFEGGQKLKAYPPPAAGSGVTVATGVDLGKRNAADLQALGISPTLTKKLAPYLGKTDAQAKTLLKTKPLSLTQDEADELDSAVAADINGKIGAAYEAATGATMDELPEEARTVLESLAYNFGPDLPKKLPTIWKSIVADDWQAVQKALKTTKWKQSELVDRRNQEAALLDPLVRRA